MEFLLFYSTKNEYGFMSNWYPSVFTCDGYCYVNMEQYMMHRKALLFGDLKSAKAIMNENDPAKIKALGRKVKPFDSVVWSGMSQVIVYRGLLAKFSQDEDLKQKLLDTGDAILVEASPFDAVWGIKMGKTNPDAKDPSKWKGRNLLGFALTEVRNTLR